MRRSTNKFAWLASAVIASAAIMGSSASAAPKVLFAQAPSAPPAPSAPVAPRVAPRAEAYPRVGAGYGSGAGVGMGSGAYLGVDVQEITSERMSALKLKEERGVEIVMVDRDAPAGKAGLKEHDVILEFNGNRVEGQEQLVRMLHETPAGRQVALGIIRDGQPMQIQVTLGDRRKITHFKYSTVMPTMPAMPVMPAMPDFDIPAVDVVVRSYSRSTGMMVDNLTPQLGEFFGVKSGQGVLVRSVEKGSAAEAAGLKAGDVIVKVDSEKIGDRNDFNRALRNRNGVKLALRIIREKREQTLTLTMPERRSRNQSWLSPDMEREFSSFDFEMDFDEPAMDELRRELPKIQRELERIGPEIQRELQRVGREVSRSVAQHEAARQRAQIDVEKANQCIKKGAEKVDSPIRVLQLREI